MKAVIPFLFLPGAALAHPHIFVDAQVTVLFNSQGAAEALALRWTYDDMFSLLLTQEINVDPDADGILTEDERRQLRDFVTDWPPGYSGDLFAQVAETDVTFGPPQDHDVHMQDGRVVETLVRPLSEPVALTSPMAIQVYDPGFYTAYDMDRNVGFSGQSGCSAQYQAADIVAANELVESLLLGRAASDVGPEEDFPQVGHAYADTIWVSCDPS